MKRYLLLVGTVLAFLFTQHSAAWPQAGYLTIDVPCDRTENVARVLKQVHDEVVVKQGIGPEGELIQLYLSKEGSFTVVVVLGNGMSCSAASGEAWGETEPVQVQPPTQTH